AKKYCLVLWDHGTGWKNVCQDWTNNDRILMPELKTALKAVRDYLGRPLDIVTYDACLMGQFDVYYQTKAYCQLQIGHEEVTGSDGLPYNTILADLKATPTMTSEQLGSTIVTRYSEAYSATGHATVSVCNMSTFDYELAEAVNIFAQKLRHKTSSYNPQVRKAWETAENYSSSYFPDGDEYLDLANFSARIKSYIADIEIQSAAQAVINRVKKMVIYEWHGTGNPGSNGITIYFPEDVYPLDALENHFPIETNWDEFLKSYYDNVSYPNLEPSSNITYPKNNAVFAQPTVVRIKGNASDDIKVETAQVKIDREDWINATSVVEWYWDWNVSNLSLGEHKIWSRAFDGLDYSNYKNITVNITSVAKNDTGVKSINHPLNNTTYEPSTITVNATVINLGELAQNNFNVSCEIKEFGSNLSFYEFDFETGAQNWTHNGTYDNWQNGTPTVGPSSAHSGANCWGTNLTGNYANLQDSNLTSPPLDLTNALNATLEFWMYLDVEDVTGNWDGGIITISPDNGTTWTQLDPSNSQGQYNAQLATGYQNPLAGKWAFCYDTSTWVQKKFNITDYIGKIIKIAFRFGSDNANTAPGWYVDDIAIKMVIPRPEITVYKNITLVTTALVQNATLNLTWNYSFVNETEYRIIVTTLLENDERPHNDYQNIVITIKVYSFTTLLQLGWNFIALPCVNASITKASELATAIGGNCTHVANWTGAEFKIYDRKTGSNDFVLQKGIGYNVYIVNGTTEFTLKGSKIANATVSLSKGWNSVALFNSTLKKASELANAIGDCSAIAHWNITLGRFVTYAVDEQLGDFQLELGKGYFVFMKISKDWTQYS
ncbi:MAG: clostripain-related cysteine peptidase, partial [Candidatus Thermoplasmatota archaeon]